MLKRFIAMTVIWVIGYYIAMGVFGMPTTPVLIGYGIGCTACVIGELVEDV